MATGEREHDGWTLTESGPQDAEHTLLLLPGGLATAAFYDDVIAEQALRHAPLRLVATTLPGHGGTTAPADVGLENYARMAARLAADLGCDVVVGHSLGANVAIEMACISEFRGSLVLLSPSFSRQDESRFLRALDRLAGVFGHLPFTAMLAMMGPAMTNMHVPAVRRDALLAEIRKNDPRFVRRAIRRYFEYLDRHGSVAQRLCDSGETSWVVFGGRGDVGLRDDERSLLTACPRVTLLVVPDAGHLTLNEKPARIAEIILDAVSGATTT